ncbi:cytochrome P450 [Apiospora aurea]|uniref:Cytochrome P450 n=1 Tax=Apiospora aurea TaxID=335848 RepID=A0ABR1Q9Z6_9PEZI
MRMRSKSTESVEIGKTRIHRRHLLDAPDYFEHILPAESPTPDPDEARHLEQIAFQLLMAGFEPIANRFYAFVLLLLQEPDAYARLVAEVRATFDSYADITTSSAAKLPYVDATIQESFRMMTTTPSGSPRTSPGAVVDGTYIAKGITCQMSQFAAARSPRHFRDPQLFRPERWLPRRDPRHDPRYAADDLGCFFPFNLGPRQCVGRESAWPQMRLFLAKVLWTFDLEPPPSGPDHHRRLPVFDSDFAMLGMWEKPELHVRFRPVNR